MRSDAEARPSVRRLLALLLPPAFALYATFNGVQQISIPLQVEAVDPSRKVEQLGLIITLCSVASVLGVVSGGAISDATRSRFGRRTPWLAGMALASATMRHVEGFASRDARRQDPICLRRRNLRWRRASTEGQRRLSHVLRRSLIVRNVVLQRIGLPLAARASFKAQYRLNNSKKPDDVQGYYCHLDWRACIGRGCTDRARLRTVGDGSPARSVSFASQCSAMSFSTL